MNLKEAIEVFEKALNHFNIKPEDVRCENPGEYLLQTEDSEIYIDIWQPEEINQWQYFPSDEPVAIYQVVSPICQVKNQKDTGILFEELTYLNFHLHFAKIIYNPDEKIISLAYKRIVNGLNDVEIIEPIEAVGYYAKNLQIYLPTRYNFLEKISPSSNL